MEREECHLFVYGSLLEPACLAGVLGHPHQGERLRAQLAGYRRVTLDGYPYPFLVPAADGVVDGVLLEDLTPDELRRLDEYEEVDQGVYRRIQAEVEAWTCGPRPLRRQAWTYIGGTQLARCASSHPASAPWPSV